jgi:Family of unknown function (DUF6636)
MRRSLIAAVLLLATIGAAPSAAATRIVHFRSPSGNLNCIAGTAPSAFVECLVRTAAWPHVRAKPATCDLDWEPYNLSLSSRRVVVGACRGDVGPRCFHDCTTLAYGKSVSIGLIRCRSALDGITCRYVRGRLAGFRIAREGYVVWRS